ncbi:unnamed protein product, partial [Prorocentrum cordatum]
RSDRFDRCDLQRRRHRARTNLQADAPPAALHLPGLHHEPAGGRGAGGAVRAVVRRRALHIGPLPLLLRLGGHRFAQTAGGRVHFPSWAESFSNMILFTTANNPDAWVQIYVQHRNSRLHSSSSPATSY